MICYVNIGYLIIKCLNFCIVLFLVDKYYISWGLSGLPSDVSSYRILHNHYLFLKYVKYVTQRCLRTNMSPQEPVVRAPELQAGLVKFKLYIFIKVAFFANLIKHDNKQELFWNK